MNRILRDLAESRGVHIDVLGDGWIHQFSRNGKVRHVYGYAFDLNRAATHQIACDKAATSQVLALRDVPHVPHSLFLHPMMARFVKHPGNWSGMLSLCDALNWDVVVKENSGTGGRGVIRVRSSLELEEATYSLFSRANAISISPYCDAPSEVRFIVLDGACLVAFQKVRPSVVGDGRRTALELLAERVAASGAGADTRRLIQNLEEDTAHALAVVPPANSEFLLNWRHNLGQGATASVFPPERADFHPTLQLALRAARALDLVFGSVDVLLTAQGPKVLEVNAGVMMEFLVRGFPNGESLARGIYEAAFDRMFA